MLRASSLVTPRSGMSLPGSMAWGLSIQLMRLSGVLAKKPAVPTTDHMITPPMAWSSSERYAGYHGWDVRARPAPRAEQAPVARNNAMTPMAIRLDPAANTSHQKK